MPLSREDRARYGADWPEFSRRIRFDRAGGRCECDGECNSRHHKALLRLVKFDPEQAAEARCPGVHGEPHPFTGSKVVLTVAHLCHTPECREHVKAMCQSCHINYDREHHAETRRKNDAEARARIAQEWDDYARPAMQEAGIDDDIITVILHGRKGAV